MYYWFAGLKPVYLFLESFLGRLGINLAVWKFLASRCFVDKPFFSFQVNVGGHVFEGSKVYS